MKIASADGKPRRLARQAGEIGDVLDRVALASLSISTATKLPTVIAT